MNNANSKLYYIMMINFYRFFIPIYTLSHTLLSYVNDLLDVA
jgi:hypothetical protein